MEAFGLGIDSDHRFLFVDVCVSSILGIIKDPIGPAVGCCLKSTRPAAVCLYKNKICKLLSDRNIKAQSEDLLAKATEFTEEDMTAFYKLDEDITRMIHSAERKLHRGHPYIHGLWSSVTATPE